MLYFRLMAGAEEAEDEDRFKILLGELASLSDATGQVQFRLKALEDSRLVDKCEMLEEKEGRINSEALGHVIIKGSTIPYLDKGDDLQQRLKAQVVIQASSIASMNKETVGIRQGQLVSICYGNVKWKQTGLL